MKLFVLCSLALALAIVTVARADESREAPAVSVGTEAKQTQDQQSHLRKLAGHSAQCNGNDGTTRSTYMGCFANKVNMRAFPFEAQSRGHTPRDCESECIKKGYPYFAREFKGQCFCGTEDDEHDIHGLANGCDCCGDNVGSNKMCVWKVGLAAPKCGGTSGTDHSHYVGCYKNKNNARALPDEIFGVKSRGHSPEDCEEECEEEGYTHFAREFKGQCFCGNADKEHDHDKHGDAKNCNCCGDNVGNNKMCVWEIGP